MSPDRLRSLPEKAVQKAKRYGKHALVAGEAALTVAAVSFHRTEPKHVSISPPEPAASAPVLGPPLEIKTLRDLYSSSLNPEQQEIFLAHEKDAKRVVQRIFKAANTLEMIDLVPDAPWANSPEYSSQHPSWRLETKDRNRLGRPQRIANLSLAYNENGNLYYAALSGTISKEIADVAYRRYGVTDLKRSLLDIEEQQNVTREALEALLNLPSNLRWEGTLEWTRIGIGDYRKSEPQNPGVKAEIKNGEFMNVKGHFEGDFRIIASGSYFK